jgi:hypothetical protein
MPREPCMQPVLSSTDTACSPPRLAVDLDPAQAGQDVGRLAVHHVAAVQLGRDLHRQRQLAPGRSIRHGLGHGAHEVAAQADEACTLPRGSPSQASTVFMPLSRGGSKPYCSFSLSSGASSGFSVMPTVRWPCTLEWPAHRADAGARLADIPAQQQQVDQHLHVLHAVAVLGQAHAVDADHGAAMAYAAAALSRAARVRPDSARSRPSRSRAPPCGEVVEAVRVLRDEFGVEHARARRRRRASSSSRIALHRPISAAVSPPALS